MKLRTALLLAAALHAIGILVLWRAWPAALPEGEVVPLELRAADPPPEPPAPAPAAPGPAAPAGGAVKKRASRMTIALQPEPAGDVPREPSPVAETLNSDPGIGSGGGPGGGGGGSGGVGSGGVGGGGSGGVGGGGVGSGGNGTGKIDLGPLRAQAMERIRQQRRYPELARRRRIEGTVSVLFRVAADGSVTGVRVKKSADELLDEAALEAVRAAAPLPPQLAQDGELEVLLQFYLRP